MSTQSDRKIKEPVAEYTVDGPARNAQTPADPYYYYYDSHPTEEDLMGDTVPHDQANFHLRQVLDWLFDEKGFLVAYNLNIYTAGRRKDYPLAPDLAVYPQLLRPDRGGPYLTSWSLAVPGQSAPAVVFEVASEETWGKDVTEKPARYAAMGVEEYYFFTPDPGAIRGSPRLLGWRGVGGRAVPVELDEQGCLWSEWLQSRLVPEDHDLALYDIAGSRRLTAAEAAEARSDRLVAEKSAAEAAERAAQARSDRLEALLKAHGIDPDQH